MPNWEDIKLEQMFLINCAKYPAHKALQHELVRTGDLALVGAPSTWEWSRWNGRIQMLIRKIIVDGNSECLSALRAITAEALDY